MQCFSFLLFDFLIVLAVINFVSKFRLVLLFPVLCLQFRLSETKRIEIRLVFAKCSLFIN
jgi:hypothetical protein